MPFWRPALFLCVLAAIELPAVAGGLIQKLPEDGAWVQYHMNYEFFGPGAVDEEGTGSWTVKSVGTATANGDMCRWIEFEETLNGPKREYSLVTKFLIPEQYLVSGDHDPLSHAVRQWYRRTEDGKEQDPVKLEGPLSHGWYSMYLPGSPRSTKEVSQPRKFPYQRGDLACQTALEEEIEHQVGGTHRMRFKNTLWQHRDVPFGAAGARYVTTAFDETSKPIWTFVRKFSLNDFGTGATSDLLEAE